MATVNQKLAEALKALKRFHDKNIHVLHSSDLKEVHRIVLVEQGFLRPVIKGWYITANPGDQDGDATAWNANYWTFLSGYLNKRFKKNYCLNAEASLLLHTGSTLVPGQITVVSIAGGTSIIDLPFGTSMLIYPAGKNFPSGITETKNLQVLTLAEALCRLAPKSFIHHAREAEIALRMITDIGELLSILLENEGMPTAAGRLAGALRFTGRGNEADRIIHTMKLAKYAIRESNPFETAAPALAPGRERSPNVLRLAAMWASWRDDVLNLFPPPPGLPADTRNYLANVDERYVSDAYNSLSIEGYQVTNELIDRIARQGWNPDTSTQDKQDRNAMAARGYYQAFQSVRNDLPAILAGTNPGSIIRNAHHRWHAELFAPAVTAGILEPWQLSGYRNGPVYIRNSRHIPLPHATLPDVMDALFTLIENEPEAAVRALLGHHLFVFIHPYFDGNGRLGRFLMNALLASGGYPWTIIRNKQRQAYLQALETASTEKNIKPLIQFIAQEMQAEES
jgi:hypothetical protein